MRRCSFSSSVFARFLQGVSMRFGDSELLVYIPWRKTSLGDREFLAP